MNHKSILIWSGLQWTSTTLFWKQYAVLILLSTQLASCIHRHISITSHITSKSTAFPFLQPTHHPSPPKLQQNNKTAPKWQIRVDLAFFIIYKILSLQFPYSRSSMHLWHRQFHFPIPFTMVWRSTLQNSPLEESCNCIFSAIRLPLFCDQKNEPNLSK